MSITPEKLARLKELATRAEQAWDRDIDEWCGIRQEREDGTKEKDEFFSLVNELIETVPGEWESITGQEQVSRLKPGFYLLLAKYGDAIKANRHEGNYWFYNGYWKGDSDVVVECTKFKYIPDGDES